MKDWREVNLGEICTKITDGAHHSPKSVECGLPMASVKDLTGFGINLDSCRMISDDDFHKLIKQGCMPEVGDVLIAKDGATALDTVCLVRKPVNVVLLSSVAILRPDNTQVDGKFLQLFLDASTTKAYMKAAFTTGAAIPRVILKDFKRAHVHLPPLPTQRRIASILSSYDDLIENNMHRIAILEEMARRLYEEWFVKFRFPGHEDVIFKETELGVLPEEWSHVPLGDMYKTSSGGTPSRKQPDYYEGDILWVKTKELNDGPIFDTEEKITELGLSKSSAKLFPPRSVIIAMYGATIGQLGVLLEEASTNQACCALLPSENSYGWAYAFLTMMCRRQDLIDLRAGAAQQNISQAIIKQFPVIAADSTTHEMFEEAARPLLELTFVLQRKNANLRAQRDLLLLKLVSGQIDVSEIELLDIEEVAA